MNAAATFCVNGRDYDVPGRPVVVICIDGCADEYLSAAMDRGRAPHITTMSARGYRGLVRAALPAFTNVNNAAICTGLPPSKTGICGNFFLDPDSGEEVMTNSPHYLRAPTILASAAQAGRKVAFVTAKDKLRAFLSDGLEGIAFSSEKADEARTETHGIDEVEAMVGEAKPTIYSGDASIFVLKAGAAMIESGKADFLYLSLTDYVQHKYSPEEPEVLAFYEDLDREIGRMLELGAVVGITADHGMNAKHDAEGLPKVLYLQTELEKRFGEGIRVICPITDPYVVHHGALGGAVTVYLPESMDRAEVLAWIAELDGISEVYTRELAARKLELEAERIGDIYVLATRDVVIGRRPEDHDLSGLDRPLRSHGARYEEIVPMVVSEPLKPEYRMKALGDPRNFDIFDFVCNGPSNPTT
ncbi:MAG: phosphonoacetate hydrolase [Planctomycetota bacterium]|nr:phosphonoacetate hydrolase [Planctomycetota bacterium]